MMDQQTIDTVRAAVVAELTANEAIHSGYPWTYDFCLASLKAVSGDIDSKSRQRFLIDMQTDDLITPRGEPHRFHDGSVHDTWRVVHPVPSEQTIKDRA